MDAPFVDNKRWDCVPRGADILNNSNPLSIAWLNKLWLSTSLRASNHFHRPNNAHLEASLVKVVYVIILDTILVFSLLNKLKPRANNLWIFLLYPLTVLCSVKSHFKFI
jgi:hypothetical protein